MPDDPNFWQTGTVYRISSPLNLDPDHDAAAPIFILASSHRSGTTLLQRLLNSHPKVMIWGEQDGYIERWLSEFDRLATWAESKRPEYTEYQRAGYNQFLPNICPPQSSLLRAARRHVSGLFQLPALDLGRSIWGYKEVRYSADVAVKLQALFPDARFIHLTRNVRDVFLSLKRWELTNNWRPEWTSEVLRRWVTINDSFEERGHELTQLFSVTYEDMIARQEAFVDTLASFLKLPPGSLDQGVFCLKLDGTDSHAPKVQLSSFDEQMIREVPGLKESGKRYGYDLGCVKTRI